MKATIDEPPLLLDGTRVVRYASIDASVPEAAMAGVVAGGVPIDLRIVTRLAITEDLVNPGVFLLHCNDDWETIAACPRRWRTSSSPSGTPPASTTPRSGL